jgi:hypothetical protein
MFIQFYNILLVILLRNQIELALVQAKILIFISIINNDKNYQTNQQWALQMQHQVKH